MGCVKKWLLYHHEAKPEAVSPGNLFVFGLGMDELKTIRERENRINYMLSSFEKLKENKALTPEGQPLWKKQKHQGMEPLPSTLCITEVHSSRVEDFEE